MELNRLIGSPIRICLRGGIEYMATIKSVDPNKFSVVVEWTEMNTSQQKEIDLNKLCALNPAMLNFIYPISNKGALPPSTAATERPEDGPHSSMTLAQPNYSSLQSKYLVQPLAALMNQPNRSTLSEFRSSDIATQGPCSNQPMMQHQPFFFRAEEESEAERAPPLAATNGRRRSLAPYEDKPEGMQLKRGKLDESMQQNQTIYNMIQDFRATLEMAPITADLAEVSRIRMCVRKRPLNTLEMGQKEVDVISVPGNGIVVVHEPKLKMGQTKFLENHTFQFDDSFDETATNDQVYHFTTKPLVQSIFGGSTAACFAYGQTGSGKTYTIGGNFAGDQQNSSKGIYALAAQDVFTLLHHTDYAHMGICPYLSYFEIYDGNVYDLLNKKAKLCVLEDVRQQVQMVGMEEISVSDAEQFIKLVEQGHTYRTSVQTSISANSSRSHAILQIVLRHTDHARTLHGKLSLVDLAGSERPIVSVNNYNMGMATTSMDISLLALKECVYALGMNKEHIPFGRSTLTKVLRDSFIGEKSKICVIATVSPGMMSCTVAMETLCYANSVKKLKGPSGAVGPTEMQQAMDFSTSWMRYERMCSVYDATAQVSIQEERLYKELQRGNKLCKEIQQPSYVVESRLPQLRNYCRRLTGVVMALEAAVEREQAASRF